MKGPPRAAALLALLLLAPLLVSAAEDLRTRQQQRLATLGKVSVGQKIRTASGALNTVEAILDSTHAARMLRTEDLKQKGGTSETVSAKRKNKDGGSTSVIANRNFMSITEDQDGNPLPPPLSDAEKNLALAEETIKKAQIESQKILNQKSTALRTPPSTPPVPAPRAPSGAPPASNPNPTSSSTYGSPSAPRFRASEKAVRAGGKRVAVQRSQRARAVTANASEAQLVAQATRANALAEVKEALEAATKTNERNARHDEERAKEHSAKRLRVV